MSTPALTLKDAWRQLRNEGSTAVGYHAFRLWSIELFGEGERWITVNRDPNFPDSPSMLEQLRAHAILMSRASGTQVKRNAQNKLQLLKALRGVGEPIRGSRLISLADQYGAVSPATLYRRGTKANNLYSLAEARNFVVGGKFA